MSRLRAMGLCTALLAVGCTDGIQTGDETDLTGCPSTTTLAAKKYAHLPDGYEGMAAVDKQSALSKLLTATEYPAKCGYPNGGIGYVAFAVSKPIKTLDVTLDTSSDEIPAGRKKFIHPFGSVATFDFVKGAQHPGDPGAPYTGILEPSDTVKGVIRLSLAGDPTPQPTGNVRYDIVSIRLKRDKPEIVHLEDAFY